MTDLTLGASLNDPMVPDDDNPTISMQAIGDDPSILPWETRQSYRLNSYALSRDGLTFASATVGEYKHHPDSPPPGFTWLAHCAIVGADVDGDISGQDFREWCTTDEAARSAVEEFIAAWIDVHLSEDRNL